MKNFVVGMMALNMTHDFIRERTYFQAQVAARTMSPSRPAPLHRLRLATYSPFYEIQRELDEDHLCRFQ